MFWINEQYQKHKFYILLLFLLMALNPLHKNYASVTPSFFSLKSGEVNVRVGPGPQYPILWILHRQFMPIKIVAEFGYWKKIQDWKGTQGWVHQNMLSQKKTLIVLQNNIILRKAPSSSSSGLAILEKGVIAELLKLQEGWCYVKIPPFKGWVKEEDVWIGGAVGED